MTLGSFRNNAARLLCFLGGLALVGCGGGGADFPTAESDEIALVLSSPSSTLPVGSSLQLTAIAQDVGGNPLTGLPSPSFATSDPARATVDDLGKVTGASAGPVRITATLDVDGESVTASTQILVIDPPPPGINLITTPGTSFSPPLVTIAVGDSVRWDFIGATHNVSFLGQVPAGGDIPDQQPGSTATRLFATPGTYQYECTRHSGMAGVVVVQSGTRVFTSVSLAPSAPSLAVGAVVQLAATPLDQDGNAMAGLPAPVFSTSDASIATVTPSGVAAGVTAGNVSITASITSGNLTRTATSQVTVTTGTSSGTTITTPSLTFAPASLTIPVGTTVTWQFSGATHNVTFLGQAPAGGDISDQSPGSNATRTFDTGGTYDYECTRHSGMSGTVVVQAAGGSSFSSVTLTPGNPQLTAGASVQVTATPRDQVGNALAGFPPAVFTSNDASIATVSAGGLVQGVAPGSVLITAAITNSGITHSASITITVSPATSGSATVTTPNLTFNPGSVSIPVGGTVTWQFSGSTHNVTFLGTTPTGGNIGDTSPGGSASRTFNTPGTYSYECTRHDGMAGSVVVQGGSGTPVFTAVRLTPQSGVVAIGSTLQLTAEAMDQFGAVLSGAGPATFVSGTSTRATVSSSGVVTGLTAGTATITATITHAGVTRSATASVLVRSGNEPVVTTSADEFRPDDVQISAGETVIWNFTGATHNVTFEDLAPPGGNIGDTGPGNAVARTFTTNGDYDYECTIHKGMKGRIRVR